MRRIIPASRVPARHLARGGVLWGLAGAVIAVKREGI